LGMAATALAVVTLWVLRWFEKVIPREHRARLVLACEPSWNVLAEVSAIVGPKKFDARFQECRHQRELGKAEYVFELAWRRPEHAIVPLAVLRTLDEQFEVTSFELTSDNGR
jgi:putative Mg2+ transporter-C (MgtC) family protein